LTKYPHFLEQVLATMTLRSILSSCLPTVVRPMNNRNATIAHRRRENIKFEQERVDSLDHDLQRAGGIKQSKPSKETKPKAKEKTKKPAE
jgi:hypothetical protein